MAFANSHSNRIMLCNIGIVVLTVVSLVKSQTTEPIPCNVMLQPQSSGCPIDHCCVHDDILFTYTHCAPHGSEHEPCSTKPSAFECQCADGLTCVSNIHGPHESLFGKCQRSPGTTDGTAPKSTDQSLAPVG